jgi:hypothetical protein
LIFDLGDTIPEGIYLEMMNHTKTIYDELKKKIKIYTIPQRTINQRVRIIKNEEDKLYILRRIMRRGLEDGNISLSFYEKNDLLFPIRSGFRGVSIRLFSAGNTYKFMCVSKINIKSIKYDILYITEGREPRIKKNNTLKFKDGDYYDALSCYSTKQILFYNTSGAVCHALINDENFNLNWEDAEIDNSLTIWN